LATSTIDICPQEIPSLVTRYKRRGLVVTLGSLALAGCGSDDGSTANTATTAGGASTPTATETATPTETPYPTPTPSPTPTPRPIAYRLQRHQLTVDGEPDDLTESNAIALGDGPRFTLGGTTEYDAGGHVWFTWDDEGLGMTAVVDDDEHTNSNVGDRNWDGDAIQIGIANDTPRAATGYDQIDVSLSTFPTSDEYVETVIHRNFPSPEAKTITEDVDVAITRDDEAEQTVYELRVPWSAEALSIDAETSSFGLAFTVNDRDEEWGWREWAGEDAGGSALIYSKHPSLFSHVELGD
jgi:hypothetical protein